MVMWVFVSMCLYVCVCKRTCMLKLYRQVCVSVVAHL